MVRRRGNTVPIELFFPFRGRHKNFSYAEQPLITSARLRNVRPYGTQANRARGGQRPGLIRAYTQRIGGGGYGVGKYGAGPYGVGDPASAEPILAMTQVTIVES